MATSESTAPTARDESTGAIWVRIDELAGALENLEALLMNTYGNSLESFSLMNDSLRDAYLGHCADLAGAAKKRALSICTEAQGISQAMKRPPVSA